MICCNNKSQFYGILSNNYYMYNYTWAYNTIATIPHNYISLNRMPTPAYLANNIGSQATFIGDLLIRPITTSRLIECPTPKVL